MATNTAASFTSHTGNNTAGPFSISFSYLSEDEIDVTVDGVLKTKTTHYTFPSATTISFTSGNHPANSAAIKFQRDTNISAKKVDFVDGAILTESDLDTNTEHLLFGLQEVLNHVDTKEFTSAQIQDGTIVNADINASAAIAGTKISPNFGSQNIVTSGTVDGRDVSADGSKLDGIDTGAKDDQTAAEIRTLVESASDSNVFTDADHTKLNGIDTGAKDDQTASEIKTLLQSDKLTASEIANGTITSTQIATGALDGRYYTETESDAKYFNISTGDTIKDGDAFPDNDTTIATTAAINDRIIDLVDDVGGFVPIANETSFPAANPDVNNGTGTLVSVKAFASSHTPSGGSVTIANGAGSGNTVTITGCGSTVLAAGFGGILETTSTLHTYTFHRLTPKATEVTTVAGISANITTVAGISANVTTVAGSNSNVTTVATNITNVNNVGGSIANVNTVATNLSSVNDFAARYRVASSDPTSSLDVGDLVFNSSSNELRIYNGSAWQAGVTATGNLVSKSGDQMTGNLTFSGSQTVDGRDVSVDGTKLDGIATSANNYSIATDLLDEDNFATNSATKVASQQSIKAYVDASGLSLIDEDNFASNSATQPPSQQSVKAYVDTADALKANLGGATFTGNIVLGDNVKAQFGTGNDAEIYFDTSNLYIKETTGSGDIYIESDDIYLRNNGGTEIMASFKSGAEVELYHNGSLQCKTASYGLDFADNKRADFGSSSDLLIYHDGTHSYFDNNTGHLVFRTNVASDVGSNIYLQPHDNEDGIVIIHDGAVELYYDGSKKFETTSGGIKVIGNDGVTIEGVQDNSADLFFHADGGDDNADKWYAGAYADGTFHILNYASGSWEESIKASGNGSVELYYDNVKKFFTTSSGIQVTGLASSGNIVLGDNVKSLWGDGEDLQIFHDGSNSRIEDAGTGRLFISSDLTQFLNAAKDETTAEFIENGACQLYYDNSKKFETTSAGVTVTGTVSDSKGNLRSIPQNTQGSAYELLAADAGKHILASGNITWVDSRHAAGDAITIVNNTAGDITITKGTTMYNTADGNNANRTLATRGMATILWASGTVAYISGAGLS